MTNPTFLAALPRSRTAWFSNLLTWDKSIVGHDLAYADLTHAIDTGTLTGHSCSSNVLHWRDLASRYPAARWVIIERDFMAAFRASKNAFPAVTYGAFCGFLRELQELKATLHPLTLPYNTINLDTCYTIADHLGISIGPQQRVAQLLDMQVQIHPTVLASRIAILTTQEAA